MWESDLIEGAGFGSLSDSSRRSVEVAGSLAMIGSLISESIGESVLRLASGVFERSAMAAVIVFRVSRAWRWGQSSCSLEQFVFAVCAPLGTDSASNLEMSFATAPLFAGLPLPEVSIIPESLPGGASTAADDASCPGVCSSLSLSMLSISAVLMM